MDGIVTSWKWSCYNRQRGGTHLTTCTCIFVVVQVEWCECMLSEKDVLVCCFVLPSVHYKSFGVGDVDMYMFGNHLKNEMKWKMKMWKGVYLGKRNVIHWCVL